MASDPNWLDYVQAWSTVAATLVAGIGLLGLYLTLRGDRKQARIAAGPYVRVDIFPLHSEHGDFNPPEAYYETAGSLVDLAGGMDDDDTATFAACFRNYQPHSLGMAFRVAAFFVLEKRGDTASATEYMYSIVTVPYVEHGKPVTLGLFRVPRNWSTTIWLSRLAYSDLYDGFHEHSEGSNENALHGRLTCVYDGRTYRSMPEGRPAAKWYSGARRE